MQIALIKERKSPHDLRVALTPNQCRILKELFPDLDIVVESSEDRTFKDAEYKEAGIKVVELATNADVLMGIKEVPIASLLNNKTYFFFSHTIKKQAYNKVMLQEIIRKQIRLIDYECLEYPEGRRLLGFGHWAGVVGAYNGLLTWGKKYKTFDLKPAYECADYDELKLELQKIADHLPKLRIGLTGTGRVSNGALEVLRFIGIEEVSPEDFIAKTYDKPVFTNFLNHHIYKKKEHPNDEWDMHHFYTNHQSYRGDFSKYLPHTDLLINGFYWEPSLDPLFTKADTAEENFAIKVIADITCDVEGSIPITLRATYPSDPTFGWDPKNQKEIPPFSPNGIDVMAVTVLPTELPKNASADFGEMISEHVIPLLVNGDKHDILKRATITQGGKLTEKFGYLTDYVE